MIGKIAVYDIEYKRFLNNVELVMDINGDIESVSSNDMIRNIRCKPSFKFLFFTSLPFIKDKNDKHIFLNSSIVKSKDTYGIVELNKTSMQYQLRNIESDVTLALFKGYSSQLEVVDTVQENKLGLINSGTIGYTEIEKYCINCGEDEYFTYLNSTASHSCDKTTNHYECNNCGEEFTAIEDK